MAQYVFGSGQLYGIDSAGAPVQFGTLQDVSVDFSGDLKTLHGQYQFAAAVARGKSKIEGKAMAGSLDVEAYNALYFNQSVAAGHIVQAVNEAGSVPASTTYTITVANGANFDLDLGVTLVATGAKLRQVPSAATPEAGEYKVSAAGVYTFNVAQASAAVLINYLWEDTTGGKTLSIENTLMGSAPVFGLILSEKFQGKSLVMRLYSNTSDKLSLPFKQDDFKVDELTFQAQANDAGQIGYISVSG